MYEIISVILLESSFKRVAQISFPIENPELDIEVQPAANADEIHVGVALLFKAKKNEVVEIDAQIKMVGIFKIASDTPELDKNTFAKINAPAIIFPFIREHLASLSLKAGVPPILIPPINFVKLAKQKQQDEQ